MPHHGFFDSIGRSLTGPGMFGGSFQFRLVLQPLVAIALGIRFGLRDAKAGRPPFLPALRASKGHRTSLVGHWAGNALVPLLVAFAVDGILQLLINRWFRPLAAVCVAVLLVLLPYAIVRTATNRIWTHGHPGIRPPARS